MRLVSLTLCLAMIAGTSPVLAQTATPLNPPPVIGLAHPAIGPATGHTVKSTADSDRRILQEEKRLERIMTICIGC